MPSDPRTIAALQTLAAPIETYRAAVAAALEEVRALLATAHADVHVRAARIRNEFGSFAAGRIDTARLAELLGDRGTLAPEAVQQLSAAGQALQDAIDEQPYVSVCTGEDVAQCVSRKLAFMGRAFAAARVVSAARSGVKSAQNDAALHAFPYGQWSAAERRLAPPLVVSLDGADLNAGALAPFLDGAQKLLLIVRGPCAPAPLVRLITPGVLVIQAHAVAELEGLASWPGPAIGALMPATAALFVHDPGRGAALWQRLTVQMPEKRSPARLNGMSAPQQRDELLQLAALATDPASLGPPDLQTSGPTDLRTFGPSDPGASPVERLTSWLLQHATAE